MSESNGIANGYLFDGYTQGAFVAARRGAHPAVHFSYRPLLAQQRAILLKRISVATEEEAEELAAGAIASQLVIWDFKARLAADGPLATVPIEKKHVLRIHHALLNRLYRIVLGDDPGDVNPDGGDLAAVVSEEADAKN